MASSLTIEGVNASYGAVRVIEDVSLNVKAGETVTLLGTNGNGKSTLMKCVMGIVRPSAGRIVAEIDGEKHDLVGKTTEQIVDLGIALVPEGRRLFPKLTVEENLRVGLQARADGGRQIPGEIYDLFPVLKAMSRRMGGDLSGGQQQQLAIGRALVGEPRVLLLDEPTEGIQPNVIQQIGAVLRRLVETKNMTIVLVEQYLDFVKEFGRTFYIMDRGRVVAEGETKDLDAGLVGQHLGV